MLHKFLRTIRANSQDPYFKQVSLLLHGDGTNGSQNNTFIDSSTNNFSITRNGNTTQGTNTPFSQDAGYWSNYFNATSTSFLSLANNAAYTLGTSDFTIEAYIYYQGSSSTVGPIITKQNPGPLRAMQFRLTSSNALEFVFTKNSGTLVVFNTSSTTVPIHQWSHVAIVRNGLTLTLYINGVSSATNTLTAGDSIDSPSASVIIGAFNASAPQAYTNTYISNLRWVIGTAVYTANFTPSTIPLTAITNTCLLTCQSNNFKDNSSNNFAITSNGVASVQPFSPFAPTSAYSTSAIGGSMYFDGTGDNLTFATSSTLYAGAGQFTYECWIYTTVRAFQTIFLYGTTPSSSGMLRVFTQSGGLQIWNGTTQITAGNTSLIKYGAWNHIVVQRDSSNNLTSYVNGTRDYFSSASVPNYNAGNLQIGIAANTAVAFNGYISDFRFISASALYSGSTITVPTAPLTAITNTQLLLSGTNAGIFDNAMKNDLETVGNAQVSTSVTKFGTGSMSFDGTGDYLTAANSSFFSFGTKDYTVEYWVYPASFIGQPTMFDTRLSGGSVNGYADLFTTAGLFRLYIGNTVIYTSSTTISTNTWTHIAVSRSGTSLRVFINGVQDGSTVTNSTNMTDNACLVGINRSFNAPLNGYIDDLRVTKGVARYTANFTPPSGAYPNS